MNICNNPDLDWIEKNGLTKDDIRDILDSINNSNKKYIKNPIFYRLLKNYIISIPPPGKYNFLLGCSSIKYLVSKKYNKKILLLGDYHIPHNFKNTKKAITASEYFVKYLSSNTKLIDIFIEIPLFVRQPSLKDSELSYFFNRFRQCYKKRNCSFRIHATDIRELLAKDPILDVLMPLIRYLDSGYITRALELVEKIKGITDLHKYINFTLINNIPLRKEINKVNSPLLKRNLETFCLNSASHIKLNCETMLKDISGFLKNPNTIGTQTGINKYISDILALLNPVIEGYTIARMFKRVEGLYNPEPKYIVIFEGDTHIQNIRNFLIYNDFEIKFEKNEGIERKINISKLPQPIFEQ